MQMVMQKILLFFKKEITCPFFAEIVRIMPARNTKERVIE